MYDLYKKYLKLKARYKDKLVFYRLGDFYEILGEDAEIASKELNLMLTSRQCGEAERVQMCGVPHHTLNKYLEILVEKGYKIAVCEELV